MSVDRRAEKPGRVDLLMWSGVGRPLVVDGTEPCIGRVDLYFPDRRRPYEAAAAIAAAKLLCGGCHRAFECRQLARARGETDGIWGGWDAFTPKPKAGSSNRPPAVCGSDAGWARHADRGEPPCTACRKAHVRARRAR